MKRVFHLFLLLCLAGCASQRDLRDLKFEVDTLKTRLTRIEEQLKEKDRLVQQSMSQQADLQARYAEIQNDLFSIHGKIEEMEASSGVAVAGGGDSRITALEKDFEAIKGQVKQKSLYETGIEKFNAGSYEDALEDMKSFLAHNPDKSLIDNAHFWIGESLFALGRYEDAILRYDRVVKKFPSSEKMPDCLLKQGMSFIKMGDKETGGLILQHLIKKYSKTDAAAKANKIVKDGLENG